MMDWERRWYLRTAAVTSEEVIESGDVGALPKVLADPAHAGR